MARDPDFGLQPPQAAGTLSTSWQQRDGRISSLANAAKVEIELTYCMNSGWIAFDEVTLRRVEQFLYYYTDNQRVAMRQNGTLYRLLQDHLGSTTITASSTGSETGEVRYYPWGQERYNSGTTPTSFRFTGEWTDVTVTPC